MPNSLLSVSATATVALTVTVFRCASAECNEQTEMEQALDRARDAWVLDVGLRQRHLNEKDLFPEPQCSEIQWQGTTTPAPFGAIGATVLSVSVQLDPQ